MSMSSFKFAPFAITVIATSLISGCAGSPARLAFADEAELRRSSNYDVCRAAYSMYSNQKMDAEVQRRGVDCAPYVAAARAAKRAQMEAGLSMMQNQPAPAPATVQPQGPRMTQCSQLGYAVTCTTY